jgi:DNA-binding transcriptional regulator GbsR (MarR family)
MYTGKIRDIELEISGFFHKMAILNGRTPKISVIFAYFHIHQKLTQKILRNLTKYSKATISSKLAEMLDLGLIKKKFIDGTHILEYSLSSSFFEFDYLSNEGSIKQLQEITNFFTPIKDELTSLSPDLLGHELLLERVEDFLFFAEMRLATKLNQPFRKDLNDLKPFIYPVDPDFDLKIEEIEKKIHDYLINTKILEEINKKSAEISAYFFTRANLSQKFIAKRTTYSTRTIYLILDQLQDNKVITKDKKNHGYLLESITIRFRLSRFNYVKKILSWKPQFIEIQKKLRDKNKNLNLHYGYPNIYTMVDKIILKMEKMNNWHESNKDLISKYENIILHK